MIESVEVRAIEELKLRTLYSNSQNLLLALLVLPNVLLILGMGPDFIYWYVAYVLVGMLLLIRSLFLNSRLRKTKMIEDLRPYLTHWWAQTCFLSMMWGGLPWIDLFQTPDAKVVLGIVIAGVCAGTAITSASHPRYGIFYSILVLTSYTASLIYQGQAGNISIAVMGMTFLITLIFSQLRLGRFFLKTFHQVLELEEARETARKSYEAALKSSRLAAMGEMTANLAHEINNPLAVIHLKFEKILRDKRRQALTDETVMEAAEKGLVMIDRIQKIIDTTKKYYYQKSDESRDQEEFHFKACMEDITPLFERRCLNLVQLHVGPVPDVVASGAELLAGQILTNLFNNAFDAVINEKERKISISFLTNDENLWVKVQDSGPGVPANKRQSIFEPFYTTKGKGAGTGLGLSICLALSKQMGADLWLEDGLPTTFTFQLRLCKSKPKAIEA